ncbi:hypothetical protein [Cyanobacterium aponinum]|uniref:Uncharacterized protein n=1 Tax=Cyanobacterium aponinum (strain PCC 10605) TaxID=755178 RepID=K9Z1V3_CYAAP|nr:hypothetical protein [Cyanobacterium aponinum]AFZ52358.1 hypothetical protein Cyan10605_0202 [Cyanobacterium aponinum PCC 10605]
MNNYTWVYIQNHPQETKRLLGINYEQLQQLIDYLKFLEDNENKAQETKKKPSPHQKKTSKHLW